MTNNERIYKNKKVRTDVLQVNDKIHPQVSNLCGWMECTPFRVDERLSPPNRIIFQIIAVNFLFYFIINGKITLKKVLSICLYKIIFLKTKLTGIFPQK